MLDGFGDGSREFVYGALMRYGGVIFSLSSWEPQEEGMMNIAARFFPQLRNQGLSFRRGVDK
jgi:hypothetical protein